MRTAIVAFLIHFSVLPLSNATVQDTEAARTAKYQSTKQTISDLNFLRAKIESVRKLTRKVSVELNAIKKNCLGKSVIADAESCGEKIDVLYSQTWLYSSDLTSLVTSKGYQKLISEGPGAQLHAREFFEKARNDLSKLTDALHDLRQKLLPLVAKAQFDKEVKAIKDQEVSDRRSIECQLAPIRLKKSAVTMNLDIRTAEAKSDGYLVLKSVNRARHALSELDQLKKDCTLSPGDVELLNRFLSGVMKYDNADHIRSLGQKACDALSKTNDEVKSACANGITPEVLFILHHSMGPKGIGR